MDLIHELQEAIKTCRSDGSHPAADFFEEILAEVKKLKQAPKGEHSPVELAAIAWWRSYAQEGWDDVRHAEEPYVGLPFRFDFLLADTVMDLLGITPTSNQESKDE